MDQRGYPPEFALEKKSSRKIKYGNWQTFVGNAVAGFGLPVFCMAQ